MFLFRDVQSATGTGAQALLDFFLRIAENPDALSAHGFVFRFRMVAHSSHFAGSFDSAGRMTDIAGPEAIRTFRTEKIAADGQLLVTNEAWSLIQTAATRGGYRIEPARLDKPLKGLEDAGYSLAHYRLRPPVSRLSPDDLLPKLYLTSRDTLHR